MSDKEYRKIPGVDILIEDERILAFSSRLSIDYIKDLVRKQLDVLREAIAGGQACPGTEDIISDIVGSLYKAASVFMQDVINATGVVIHTNLGRAPLGEEVIRHVERIGAGYSNLEYSLLKGQRGFRGDIQEELLIKLTGAESATVVNNNAGAVFLILSAFAKGGEVIVSRGELIQIGGGFRIPDILEQSGAKLKEVGTTNRTDIADYADAINDKTKMIFKAHLSNFMMKGFVSSPADEELAGLCHQKEIIMVYDIGSGALINTEEYGLDHEPTVRDALRADADIICFSGDKLLGGPQAGIIIGKKRFIDQIKKHPLFRALRPDKLCLSALQQTLIHYLNNEHAENIPVLRMIALKPSEILEMSEKLLKGIELPEDRKCIVEGESTVGGGSNPAQTLPSYMVALEVDDNPHVFVEKLRMNAPPVIGRIYDDRVCFDLRTVPVSKQGVLLNTINRVLNAGRV